MAIYSERDMYTRVNHRTGRALVASAAPNGWWHRRMTIVRGSSVWLPAKRVKNKAEVITAARRWCA